MSQRKRPAYRVYTVEDIDEENSWWTIVGVAFAHEDKKGMNILLRALPTDGRLVLRRYTESTAESITQTPEVRSAVTKAAKAKAKAEVA